MQCGWAVRSPYFITIHFFLLFISSMFIFFFNAKQLFDYKCTSPSYYTIHNRFRMHRRLLFTSLYISFLSGCRWTMFEKKNNKTKTNAYGPAIKCVKWKAFELQYNKMTKIRHEPNHFHDIWSINIMKEMVAVTFNNNFVRFSILYSSDAWLGYVCVCVCEFV